MPATAGRVRMPANNRVHSSAALQTHGIWQSAIGYDPYAPNKDESKNTSQPKPSNDEPDAENPYNSYQGLLALARITNTNADEARGACKKCGRVGHLTFQCRNFLSVKDDIKEKDSEAIQAAVLSELDKLKGKVGKLNGKGKAEIEGASEEEEEEESDSSDSDADPEIERIIAERNGKKISSRGRSSRKKKTDVSDEDGTDSNSDSGKRKRGRSKKRRIGKRENSDSEDEDEGGRKRRMEKRRKRDRSSDEEDEYRHRKRKSRKEKRRRRSHRHSDDSNSDVSEDSSGHYERKGRKSRLPSDSDESGSDDSRGRRTKRSKKKSRKRHHERDE
ncbi:CAX-interacting protein 4 [Pistacia vera]|uniref:CAX-interacting protein 4 n=1 Tax=Pistacia vera TaxID=55513 RepID=UPI00126352D8|nr:CAX-interacting protein 4 [Pistacia vera]